MQPEIQSKSQQVANPANSGAPGVHDGKNEQVYRTSRLTVLELMTVFAVLGVLLTWVINSFF